MVPGLVGGGSPPHNDGGFGLDAVPPAMSCEPTMPYVSAAERQRQRWMTLKEALSHIQHVEKLDENAALQQLRLALAEGAVGASWAMSESLLQKAGDSP